jgi:hypothetical protein
MQQVGTAPETAGLACGPTPHIQQYKKHYLLLHKNPSNRAKAGLQNQPHAM